MQRTRRRFSRREWVYFVLRGSAGVGVVLSATLVPHGILAALLCVGFGILAVLTCIGVNAGGPGEQSGSAPFERAYARVRPPQGDWPPYDPAKVGDGELVD